jgi:hypothetical protein
MTVTHFVGTGEREREREREREIAQLDAREIEI